MRASRRSVWVWTGRNRIRQPSLRPLSPRLMVTGTRCEVLRQLLVGAYAQLGFDVLGDEAFASMVLANRGTGRKAGHDRCPGRARRCTPHRNTLTAALQRSKHVTSEMSWPPHAWLTPPTRGRPAMALYDVMTLHFGDEDDLRKVEMSKEHHIDPRVQVRLLVDPGGFPLEVHLFEGSKAETTTLIPVLTSFQERQGVADMVVVADVGMLCAAKPECFGGCGLRIAIDQSPLQPGRTLSQVSRWANMLNPPHPHL
jgi:hypothetical protein